MAGSSPGGGAIGSGSGKRTAWPPGRDRGAGARWPRLVVVLAALVSSGAAPPEWTEVAVAEGVDGFTAVAADPVDPWRWWAASGARVLSSDDGGRTWREAFRLPGGDSTRAPVSHEAASPPSPLAAPEEAAPEDEDLEALPATAGAIAGPAFPSRAAEAAEATPYPRLPSGAVGGGRIRGLRAVVGGLWVAASDAAYFRAAGDELLARFVVPGGAAVLAVAPDPSRPSAAWLATTEGLFLADGARVTRVAGAVGTTPALDVDAVGPACPSERPAYDADAGCGGSPGVATEFDANALGRAGSPGTAAPFGAESCGCGKVPGPPWSANVCVPGTAAPFGAEPVGCGTVAGPPWSADVCVSGTAASFGAEPVGCGKGPGPAARSADPCACVSGAAAPFGAEPVGRGKVPGPAARSADPCACVFGTARPSNGDGRVRTDTPHPREDPAGNIQMYAEFKIKQMPFGTAAARGEGVSGSAGPVGWVAVASVSGLFLSVDGGRTFAGPWAVGGIGGAVAAVRLGPGGHGTAVSPDGAIASFGPAGPREYRAVPGLGRGVRRLHLDDGAAWIATIEGLYRVEPHGTTALRVPLPTVDVRDVVTAAARPGRPLVATDRGLFALRPPEAAPGAGSTEDRSPSDEEEARDGTIDPAAPTVDAEPSVASLTRDAEARLGLAEPPFGARARWAQLVPSVDASWTSRPPAAEGGRATWAVVARWDLARLLGPADVEAAPAERRLQAARRSLGLRIERALRARHRLLLAARERHGDGVEVALARLAVDEQTARLDGLTGGRYSARASDDPGHVLPARGARRSSAGASEAAVEGRSSR